MPRIPTLSLLQLMKLVLFFAVAFACVAPLLRNGVTARGWEGLIAVAIFGGVAVPVVWTGLAFVLIRPGAWRDQLITSFLLCSTTVACCFACWTFVAFVLPSNWNRHQWGDLSTAIPHAAVIVTLGAACLFLARRLWKCSRPVAFVRGAEP